MLDRKRIGMLVLGVYVGFASTAAAAPLDPNSFTSLGTLNVSSGTLTINTSTLQVSGAASFTGVAQIQGAGLPEIAVFTFNSINIGAGVTVTFSGSRPVALLSKGDAVVGATLDVSGGPASDDIVGLAGPAGGASGGSGGIHDPPVAPTAGAGPGGGGVAGGGGGFGGAGGTAIQLPSSGGPAYGNLATALQGGSGGAGNNPAFAFGQWIPGGAGAGGGGAVEIGAIGQVQIASVNSRGGDVSTFFTAGGGGSGGAVLLHGTTVSVSGAITADGGETVTLMTGFGRGGGGGGGRVHAVPTTYVLGGATPIVDVAGGPGGGLAIPGASGVALWAPTLTIVPSGQARALDAAGVLSENLAGGFTLRGTDLQVNSGALVFATVPVNSVFTTTLIGGSLQATLGLTMSGAGKLSGYGQVGGPLAGSASNQIFASGGTLTVGDANSAAGFNFAGTTNVAAGATLDLRDSNKAVLGSATTLAGSGRLSSLNGADLGVGKVLSASGAAVVAGKFTNQGTINGPAVVGQFLAFTDDVDGPGGYTGNVLFSDGFSPGSSPAAVSLQNVAFDASSTLTVELGGIAAGTQYDQLNATGTATLGGTLDVDLINGFTPGLGNQFTVLTFGSRSSDFASYTGTTIGGYLELRSQFSANSLLLKARPAIDGDIDLDGTVDIFDINAVSSNWNTAGPQGDADGDGIVDIFDINLISSNWGSTGGTATAVPEPSTLILALCGLVSVVCSRGRRRQAPRGSATGNHLR